jgi:hypothetical protein
MMIAQTAALTPGNSVESVAVNPTLMLATMEFALFLRLSDQYLDSTHAAMGVERLEMVLRALTDSERSEFVDFLRDQADRSTGRVAEVIAELPETLGLRRTA